VYGDHRDMAFLAGICLKGDTTICPPGSTEIPANVAVIVAFVGLALIGFLWLGHRTRGGG
jgi:hypothetical protein